ncbi:hypothetical protein M0R45_015461 [Rubus argutus]|uniref:Disease resistance protein RPM1-like n=1 Tax=Rubus argutus TaxID=59490 RepID=A0AAW1XQ64_RUBAR
MASAATELLIDKILGILENEASSIAGVRDQVDEITQELESMKAFLEASEGNTSRTQAEDAWVARVRDLAFDVEDIIDEFMYHFYEQKIGGRIARWFRHSIQIPKNLWCRRQIAFKLQKITRTIQAIPDRNQRYAAGGARGRTSTSHGDVRKWVQKSESSLLIKEDELVGIESKTQLLMGWLMKEEHSQIVVSVVGMGGSGKTTLVAKTFTNEIVKRHFDCCAWISVSQTFVIEDLFKKLIKEFYKPKVGNVLADMNAMSCRELQEMLINYLESKRYLLVLDDVWDITLWEQIRLSFPDSRSGSRIMLTTRNEDIASCSFGAESHVYHIQPLQEKEAWDLFSKKAFSTYHDKSCPPELETSAWKLVKKCKGLPLAVVALGGLMSSKKSPDQWSRVYNSLNWHLSNNPSLEYVKSILFLSFNDLPYRLKHCFLYCSLFPEDYLINNKKLTRLWMAEGFVEHVKGITPEEVAEGYVTELIFRSMLQEVCINGATKYCISKLRAFMLFVSGTFSLSLLQTFSSRFKLLRVLDLERVPIDKCPDEVVCLFNLRYLNLRGTQLKELPESIGRLRNLQTLDLRDTKIEALPRGIVKLLNLRHLLMSRYYEDPNIFRLIDGMKTPLKIRDLLPHIEALPNLDWLRLDNACAVEDLCFRRGFVKLTHLELVNILLLEKITIEQGVMTNLQVLRFQRCKALKTIPEGFEYLTQLETFYFTSASEEFYQSIEGGGVNHSKFRQQFPNLRM